MEREGEGVGQLGREGGKERGRGMEGRGGSVPCARRCWPTWIGFRSRRHICRLLPLPTLPPAGTSVSALVVSALVVVVVVGGLFAELASVFRPEAQVGPGGSMDSLGP